MTTGRTNLLLSGGPTHTFEETSPIVAGHLAEEGVASTIVTDPDEAFARLADEPHAWDLLTVNALRWRMEADRYAAQRASWAYELGPDQERALDAYVRGGGGVLALHTAVICFDAVPAWHRLTGASWDWDRSSHPPLGPVEVTITPAGAAHPVTAGLGDFTIHDEAYGFLDVEPDVVALATAPHGDTQHPVVWARAIDRGRVVTDLLGHGAESMAHPDHAAILRAAARWALG